MERFRRRERSTRVRRSRRGAQRLSADIPTSTGVVGSGTQTGTLFNALDIGTPRRNRHDPWEYGIRHQQRFARYLQHPGR
jgi:hypothetical protein